MKAGLPGEVLSVVTGSGSKIGAYLSESKEVNLITFTGSVEVGLDIAGRSAKYLRPCLLELGGNDVSIVFEDADVDYAAEQASLKLETAGQVCCSSKRWIVHNSIKSAFIEKAAVYFVNAKVGDPMDRTTRLGPLINEKAAETVESQVNHSISQGAQLVCGGIRDGAFFAPTILDGVTPEMDVATDMEIFGPVISVIGFDTEEEAIEIANNCSMGLNAGIITSNIYRSFRLVSRLEAGTINVNACSMWRTAYAPFGGYKLSGFGRESIENTFKEVSQVKTVRIPVSGSLEKGGFEK